VAGLSIAFIASTLIALFASLAFAQTPATQKETPPKEASTIQESVNVPEAAPSEAKALTADSPVS